MTTSIDTQLIEDNLVVLRQGRALLDTLDANAYSQNAPSLAFSGVGPHLRHVLDFYGRFLSALEQGSPASSDVAPAMSKTAAPTPLGVDVDYDARERNPRLETDREYAMSVIDQTTARLRALGSRVEGADAMRIKSDGSDWIPSTVARELQSLISHTVHHYALISVAVRSHGGDPGPEFGVAPSTLRHWRNGQGHEQPDRLGSNGAEASTDACAR